MGIRRTLYSITLLAAATSAAAAPAPPPGALFWPSRVDRPFPFGGARVVDLNHDGRLDLVGYRYYHDELVVSFGHPDSLFTAPQTVLSSALLHESFRLVELNGDDNLDVLVGASGGRLFVFPGNGDGTFGDARKFSTPDPWATSTFGDMNGDGFWDMILTTRYPNASESVVLMNDGNLNFQETNRYPAEGADAFVKLADVDGNGVTDILTWRWETPLSVVLRNLNGDLLDQARVSIPQYMRSFAVGDLDDDGDGDLVVVTYRTATLFEQNADGEMDSVGIVVGDQSHYTTQFNGVQLADIDGDGDNDLLLICGDGMKNDIVVCVNNGSWRFTAPFQYDTANYYSEERVSSGVVSGDDDRDIVVVALGIANVYQGTGSPSEPFLEADRIPTDLKPYDAALADVDGDRRDELVALERDGSSGTCRLRTYDVSGRAFSLTSETMIEHSYADFEIIDLNGDPLPDVIAWWNEGDYTSGYESNVQTLRGRWGGGFETVEHRRSEGHGGDIVVGDLDGDGNDDYVQSQQAFAGSGAVLRIFSGDGAGHFTEGETLALNHALQVYLEDLDRNGLDDVIVRYLNELSVRSSTPHGLTEETVYNVRGTGLGFADVDGNGLLDIIAIFQHVRVLSNRGANEFAIQPAHPLSQPYQAIENTSIFPRDITGDGILDLVVRSGYDTPRTFVLTGNGDGTFVPHPYLYEAGFGRQSAIVADVDGDRVLDLVSVSQYGEPIRVLWGLRQNGPAPNTAVSSHITLRIAPNPFRTSATFYYAAATPGVVRATIFDVAGRQVASLVDDATDSGPRLLSWNGRTTTGATTPAGVYFVEIRQGSATGRQKVVRTR